MGLASEIKKLESDSKLLDPDKEDRKKLLNKISQYSENFLDNLSNSPVFSRSQDEGEGLTLSIFDEEPGNLGAALDLFDKHVVNTGLNPASPGHFGYIPGSGLYFSALGDFLAAVTNRYAGIYAASPGAVRMEHVVIQWLIKEVGYPKTASGDLTSGGSIANLSAIVAARDAFELKAKDFHKVVVYLTEHTHHCVGKALKTAGLIECQIRAIPVDEYFRMIPEKLEEQIEKDKNNNLKPWLLVGSAGTTNTGAVDPLEDLAQIAKNNKLWFHVDGAYGASFILCENGKKILKGIEKSDSLVVDPHKGFFTPFGTGIVLVRDGMDLHRSFRYQANYMQDEKTLAKMNELSPAELSPEMTRHYRGLRLWLPLKLTGVKPFRAALTEKLLLTHYFYNHIREIKGIETGPFPDLSIVIFRYVPKNSDANDFNEKLTRKIMEDAKIFMSSTMINGTFWLRLVVLSFRTHLEKVDQAIMIIKEKINDIEKEL